MPENKDEHSTSTEMLRKAQFQEKLCILNKEFLKQLDVWIKQCPHYDLSATVKSYLSHVKTLDRTYGGRAPSTPVKVGESANTPATVHTGRVFAKAKRRSGVASEDVAKTPFNKTTSSVVSSTPALPSAPKFRLSDVSAIAPLVEASRDKDSKKEPTVPPSGAGGRKRAIRGGGPLGDNESVVFRGTDSAKVSSSSASNPGLVNLPSLPKATPGFWNLSSSKDKEEEKKEENKQQKNIESDNEKKEDKPAAVFPSISTFGSSKLIFGASNSPFGTCKDDREGETVKPVAASFTFGSMSTAPKLTFGSTTPASVPALGTGATPFFNPPPTTSDTKKDDEEEEYVPPKAEIVENKEPGASFSVKCSVFKLNDKKYDKLGIGMLHLKDNESKKSVLVRATTTIGTVWVNALVNKSMKVSKADDVKLRLTCPASATEMNTYLIRFPSSKEADKVREHIENETQ